MRPSRGLASCAMAGFRYGKRFGETEKFRFPPPIGEATVVLAAQDEVGTVPYFLPLREMDCKNRRE